MNSLYLVSYTVHPSIFSISSHGFAQSGLSLWLFALWLWFMFLLCIPLVILLSLWICILFVLSREWAIAFVCKLVGFRGIVFLRFRVHILFIPSFALPIAAVVVVLQCLLFLFITFKTDKTVIFRITEIQQIPSTKKERKSIESSTEREWLSERENVTETVIDCMWCSLCTKLSCTAQRGSWSSAVPFVRTRHTPRGFAFRRLRWAQNRNLERSSATAPQWVYASLPTSHSSLASVCWHKYPLHSTPRLGARSSSWNIPLEAAADTNQWNAARSGTGHFQMVCLQVLRCTPWEWIDCRFWCRWWCPPVDASSIPWSPSWDQLMQNTPCLGAVGGFACCVWLGAAVIGGLLIGTRCLGRYSCNELCRHFMSGRDYIERRRRSQTGWTRWTTREN